MESYIEFMDRVNSFEKMGFCIDTDKRFIPSKSVSEKVDSINRFAPFYGDTVVFDLSSKYKERISDIIDKLFFHDFSCFCRELNYGTLHMTLHDLYSSTDKKEAEKRCEQNYSKLLYLLNYKYRFVNQKIRMRTNGIINMVNTSVVLTLNPVNEIEYEKLMYFYNFLDEVVKLPYGFTPHITLAYYNRYGFEAGLAKNLIRTVNSLNENSFEIILSTSDIVYQRFYSMNYYENRLKFGE